MPKLPQGFSSHSAQVGDIRMHYVRGGTGEPLVIVHGGLDSWWAWRDVATALANRYEVILPAIRGLAKTTKPESGYDANTLGEDVHQLMVTLGHPRYAAVGHDWGAVAAYTAAAQHREAVTRLAIFEMVMPGVGIMEQAMIPEPGGRYLWHMGWHSVPDIPQMLIAGHLREYMHYYFSHFAGVPDAVGKESLDHYVDLYSQVGAMTAFMKYYHNFWVHGEQVRVHQRRPLEMPVLAYGGEVCLGPLTQQGMEILASDVTGGVIPECGHWIAEEQPEFVAERLSEFLAGEVVSANGTGATGADSPIATAARVGTGA